MKDMPPVSSCNVEICFYNNNLMCHAPAINVGANHPCCDTFAQRLNHIHRQGTGSVGACHINFCKWNEELTCQAEGIVVGYHGDHADCDTFEAA